MDILIYLLGAVGVGTGVAFAIWVYNLYKTNPVLEPVPVPEAVKFWSEPTTLNRTEVRFAGKWIECRFEDTQVCDRRLPLVIVRLIDPRTHSRRIVRLLDDVREVEV